MGILQERSDSQGGKTMKKTTTACNRIAALTVAMLLAGTTSAWAQSTCGLAPIPPEIPENGATASEQAMEDASSGLEEYAAAFEDFNACSVEEYNATITNFDNAFNQYQNNIDAINEAAQAEQADAEADAEADD
jgi:hypothetical protein